MQLPEEYIPSEFVYMVEKERLGLLPNLECLPRSVSGVSQCAPDGTPDRGLITPRAAKNAKTG